MRAWGRGEEGLGWGSRQHVGVGIRLSRGDGQSRPCGPTLPESFPPRGPGPGPWISLGAP